MAIAARIVELGRSAEPSAEIEVLARVGASALTRFANGAIHQNVAEDVRHVSVRVALDGRPARCTLDGPPDDDAVQALLWRALEAARARTPDPDWPGLAGALPALPVDHWDAATAEAEPAARAMQVAGFVRAADGLETAGYCSTDASAVAYANTNGQQLLGRSTVAVVDGIARTGTSDGSARAASVSLGSLDGAVLGAEAARRARDAADPVDLDPGRYEVVLGPACVADVLGFLYRYGFNAQAVEERRSFVRLGERQFDDRITLRDDVTDPGQAGVAFDAEGTPKTPLTLVHAGTTVEVLYTRRTAAKARVRSTGHAPETGEEWGGLVANGVLGAGDRTADELVAGVGRGLLVTDFHYTRILDPRTEVVTGLTRNGVWLVEDGRVRRSVRNLRFTQSYVDALAPGAVVAVGADRQLVTDPDGAEPFLVPSLHLRSWNFSGGARG